MSIPKDQLDQLSNVEATQWFEGEKRKRRGYVIRAACEYYERAQTAGLENAEEERRRLFETVAALDGDEEAQAAYFAERKAGTRADRTANVARNLEEGRRQHREAVERALAEGRVTDAVRKAWAEERLQRINAAHANPDPMPYEPVVETREERIVNDQLRSFGSVLKVNTGNIEYRLHRKRGRENGSPVAETTEEQEA